MWRNITLAHETDFEGWREGARALIAEGVPPEQARFTVGAGAGLFDQPVPEASAQTRPLVVPRAYLDLARDVILHRSPDRFDLLYRMLWRLQDERNLMRMEADEDVRDAVVRARNVSRAAHKMKAFVRFRLIDGADHGAPGPGDERWIAWFEPAHRVLERTAPFFARRFSNMTWSILTPDARALWDGHSLRFGPPARPEEVPEGDPMEDMWRTYYASTFNPARLRTRAMQSEMPRRYWNNLPEARLIPELVKGAEARARQMIEAAPTPANTRFAGVVAPSVPRAGLPDALPEMLPEMLPDTLDAMGQALARCRRCPLWRDATAPVAGEGSPAARIMIVGEQPGDQEDLAGRPFIGPAGQVLDAALASAGLARGDVWLTNAVKHFKFTAQGKRRLHRSPDATEIGACSVFLDHERRLIRPKVVVMLGASAASAVLGRKVEVGALRGQRLGLDDGSTGIITWHPAYVLRLPDAQKAAAARQALADDLARALKLLSPGGD
ncbi:MAG: UdgX family uracil-DNA binding protein [Brevundimonas sp.]|uniref:UdgX family uracil-DNA binding protein n=1 Tax=Brevundimonas sp. TaxID=1871086 RepID=UPI00391946ED